MNEIVNKILLARDKFMLEMHFRQTEFIYSPYGPFTKIKKRIKKFKETGDSRYIYQTNQILTMTWAKSFYKYLNIFYEFDLLLDKYFLQHDMAYGDFKD